MLGCPSGGKASIGGADPVFATARGESPVEAISRLVQDGRSAALREGWGEGPAGYRSQVTPRGTSPLTLAPDSCRGGRGNRSANGLPYYQ